MKITRLLSIAIFLTVSTLTANAQCDTEAYASLYDRFLKDYQGKAEQRKVAAEAGKEFLKKFGHCEGDYEKRITSYVRDWIARHEAAVIRQACTDAVDSNPSRAFDLCKPYVALNPENLRAHLLISLAGIRKTSDKSLNEQTLKAINKSLDLIRGGAKADPWIIGSTIEEATSTLEFYSGYLIMDKAPAEAAAIMLKLAHSSSGYSKDPNTYFHLARSLHNGEVKKQLADHVAKCPTAVRTAECEAGMDTIEAAIDRVIDAYARAVAYSQDKPEHKQILAIARPELATLWKQRHEDGGAGLDKYVAEILSKRLP